MLNLKVLGSSSKGNCIILESPTGKLLLDCGIPFRLIQKGLNFDLNNVVGCLCTHEHKDHSKAVEDILHAGITVIAPKYMDADKDIQLLMTGSLNGYTHTLGDFNILSFDTHHDVPSLGYIIAYKPTGDTILFATDTYMIKYNFRGLNYILLECNYCKDTLDRNVQDGLIDVAMKKRLLKSHFSLENVKVFLDRTDLSTVYKIVLLHLSDNNSDSEQILREVSEYCEAEIADDGKDIVLGCGF